MDNQRVPNSGLQSTVNGSTSSIDKPSLVYQLQKMNGMEKKRRSRTRRDQPTANKPGHPYQKSSTHPRADYSATESTSPDPSDRSPSRRMDASRVARVETSSSHLDPLIPRTWSNEHRSPYPTISPSRSSSPSSPYYHSAGTSSSSPGSGNSSPLRALPMRTPTFDHFQYMVLTTQSTPDFLSPSSPGYHELQSYSHEPPGNLRLQYSVCQIAPIDEPGSATAQLSNIYGPNRSCWNNYDRPQGRFEPSVYPHSLASHTPALNDMVPRLAHRAEQSITPSSLPPISHGLGTPPTENADGDYIHSAYEDRTAGTSLQNLYLHTNCSSNADPSTTVPYYS